MKHDKVLDAMRAELSWRPEGIAHTMEVVGYAEQIMDGEGITGEERERTLLIAVLHDIGIPEALREHGSFAAPYQEAEGAPIAERLLTEAGYDKATVERVSYVVGHHHQREAVEGRDFEVQWDADLLGNYVPVEPTMDAEELSRFIATTFVTATGKAMARGLLRAT